MAYYNNNSLLQQLFPQNVNMSQVPLSPVQPRIDPQQFASVAATLDDNSLNQLVAMARSRGISDQDIQNGLNIINQYRRR